MLTTLSLKLEIYIISLKDSNYLRKKKIQGLFGNWDSL